MIFQLAQLCTVETTKKFNASDIESQHIYLQTFKTHSYE
jgi:hypothetical protein